MKDPQVTSTLTLLNRDKSKRVLHVFGRYSQQMAIDLSRDLEGQNYLSVSVVIN